MLDGEAQAQGRKTHHDARHLRNRVDGDIEFLQSLLRLDLLLILKKLQLPALGLMRQAKAIGAARDSIYEHAVVATASRKLDVGQPVVVAHLLAHTQEVVHASDQVFRNLDRSYTLRCDGGLKTLTGRHDLLPMVQRLHRKCSRMSQSPILPGFAKVRTQRTQIGRKRRASVSPRGATRQGTAFISLAFPLLPVFAPRGMMIQGLIKKNGQVSSKLDACKENQKARAKAGATQLSKELEKDEEERKKRAELARRSRLYRQKNLHRCYGNRSSFTMKSAPPT